MGGPGSGRRPPAPCGTRAAYQRHWRRGEDCAVCKAAAAQEARRRYKPSKRAPAVPLLERHKDIVRTEKLLRGSCLDCGLVIDDRTIVCIDFDHRDPSEKSFTISQQMGRVSISALIVEMAKCDAVCRNCHAIRTHIGRHWAHRRILVEHPSLWSVGSD